MWNKLIYASMVALLLCGAMEAGVIERAQMKQTRGDLPPRVKILVLHNQQGAILEVKGMYKIYDPYADKFIDTRFMGKRRYIQAVKDGLRWGEEFPYVHQIMILPSQNATILVNGIEYQGNMYIYDVGGTISIVNEPTIEHALHVLLASKAPDNLSPETLAAIAIAARTNMYYLALNPKSPFWSVEAGQVGYMGHVAANPDSPIGKAIDDTHHLILSRGGDTPSAANPFPAQWDNGAGRQVAEDRAAVARITMFEAEDMARQGEHAAKILNEAFPNTNMILMYSAPR